MIKISKVAYYIWLSLCINYTSIQKVLDRFETPEQVFVAEKDELLKVLNPREVSNILKKDFSEAQDIINKCFEKEITILTIKDTTYPDILRNIDNPPLVLYIKGRLPDMDALVGINIIGTRKSSAYGQIITKKLAYALSDSGAIIVSGMATGIDTIANKTAVLCGKPTIAVLGCSVDICYPPSNRALMDDIIAVGAVISEFPPETRPHSANFPQRNRIMSGISKGTLVIEAPEKSGTLITANYALEQGRDVFAVPGNIDNENSRGCNALIKNGAKMVTSVWDILEEYGDGLKKVIKPYQQRIEIEVLDKPETKLKPLKRTDMTDTESIVYDIIKNGADSVDKIILNTDMSVSEIMSTITMLEIYGDIINKDKRLKIKEN